MKTVSISRLKASLSEFLTAVEKGEEVLVTNRGVPVARIIRVEGEDAQDARRARLARQGLLQLRRRKPGKIGPPLGKESCGVLAALLEERAEGR